MRQRQDDGEEFAAGEFPGQGEACAGRREAGEAARLFLAANRHADRKIDSQAQMMAGWEVVVLFKDPPELLDDDRPVDLVAVEISRIDQLDALAVFGTTGAVFLREQEFVGVLRAGRVDTKAPLLQQRR